VAAGRAMASGQAAVVLTLYRALARAARRFDRDPALKALVSLSYDRFYDHESHAWSAVEREHMRGYTELAVEYLGGPLYRPKTDKPRTLHDFVRAKFREAGPGISQASAIGSRLDAAFAALSEMNHVASLSESLPRTRYQKSSITSSGHKCKVLKRVDALPDKVGGKSSSSPLLLAAHPMQLCSSLGRGIILLSNHSEEGSDGLLVNKPSCIRMRHASRLLGARIPSHELGPLRRNRLYIGGPVPGPLMVLHPHACLIDVGEENQAEESEGVDEGDAASSVVDFAKNPAPLDGPDGLTRDLLEVGEGKGQVLEEEDVDGEVHLESPKCGPVIVSGPDAQLYCTRVNRTWVRRANALLSAGKASIQDFKFILGHCTWGPHQLQGEFEHGEWVAAAPLPHEMCNFGLSQSRKALVRTGPITNGADRLDGVTAEDGQPTRARSSSTNRPDSLAHVISSSEARILHLMREEGGRMHLNRSQRGVFLHTVLDEEMVPTAGQHDWARVLTALGAEYRSFATLARAQEEQCALLLEAEGERDELGAELTYEEE